MTRICGRANGQPASLEVTGDTLTWRGTRAGPTPGADNVATTVHDIKDVAWHAPRWSAGGLACLALAAVIGVTEGPLTAAVAFAVGAGLTAHRLARPVRRLVLACGDRRLVLEVDAASAAAARTLAARIRETLLSGDAPASPPTLP